MGRDKYEFPPSGKPVVKYTFVQQNMAREQQLALEVRTSPDCAPAGLNRPPAALQDPADPPRLSWQSHHESHLPCQRYKESRKQPPARNPIVPSHIPASMLPQDGHIDGYEHALQEINARSRLPLPTSNPIFGYSVHRAPPVMQGMPTSSSVWDQAIRADTPVSQASASTSSTTAKVRMAELQQKIEEEREKRKSLEAMLASE